MVKKKRVVNRKKNVHKRKVVKRRKVVGQKSSKQVAVDLEIFEKGVERLKELTRELNRLDTRGFANDDKNIRANLKNVSDIPLIEKQIKNLSSKINNKYKPPRHRNKQFKDIKEDISKVKNQLPIIKGGIFNISRKLKELTAPKKGSIDAGIGNLIDIDFDNFLRELKIGVTDRIKQKEKRVDLVLKDDLKVRENKYKIKSKKLLEDYNLKNKKIEEYFNRKYNVRVNSSLKSEVTARYNEEIKIGLDTEKRKIRVKYIKGLRNHFRVEIEKKKNSLKNKYKREFLKDLKELNKERFNDESIIKREKEKIMKIKRFERDKLINRLNDLNKIKQNVQNKLIKGRIILSSKEKRLKEIVKKKEEKINEILKMKEEKININLKKRELRFNEVLKKRDLIINDELKKRKIKFNKLILGKRKFERVELIKNEKIIRDKLNKEKIINKKKLLNEMNTFNNEKQIKINDLKNREKLLINDREIEKEKIELLNKLKFHLESDKEKLKMDKVEIKESMKKFEDRKKDYRVLLKQNLLETFNKKFAKDISKKENKIRAELKQEFDNRLQAKTKEADLELKKRKLMIETELQNKMKQMFK